MAGISELWARADQTASLLLKLRPKEPGIIREDFDRDVAIGTKAQAALRYGVIGETQLGTEAGFNDFAEKIVVATLRGEGNSQARLQRLIGLAVSMEMGSSKNSHQTAFREDGFLYRVIRASWSQLASDDFTHLKTTCLAAILETSERELQDVERSTSAVKMSPREASAYQELVFDILSRWTVQASDLPGLANTLFPIANQANTHMEVVTHYQGLDEVNPASNPGRTLVASLLFLRVISPWLRLLGREDAILQEITGSKKGRLARWLKKPHLNDAQFTRVQAISRTVASLLTELSFSQPDEEEHLAGFEKLHARLQTCLDALSVNHSAYQALGKLKAGVLTALLESSSDHQRTSSLPPGSGKTEALRVLLEACRVQLDENKQLSTLLPILDRPESTPASREESVNKFFHDHLGRWLAEIRESDPVLVEALPKEAHRLEFLAEAQVLGRTLMTLVSTPAQKSSISGDFNEVQLEYQQMRQSLLGTAHHGD